MQLYITNWKIEMDMKKTVKFLKTLLKNMDCLLYTSREKETAELVQNFTSLINTIIISPRRWGKSSLVNKAAKLAMAQDSNLRICHIDLFNVRSEEHFYSLLAQKVIAATSTKWEEAIESAKSFFSHLVPKISIGTDPDVYKRQLYMNRH